MLGPTTRPTDPNLSASAETSLDDRPSAGAVIKQALSGHSRRRFFVNRPLVSSGAVPGLLATTSPPTDHLALRPELSPEPLAIIRRR